MNPGIIRVMADAGKSEKSQWGSPNQAKVLVVLLVVLGLVIFYAVWLSSYKPSF